MGYKDYTFWDQVNIGNKGTKLTHPSAYLELGKPAGSNRGLLLPRGNKDSIVSPAYGLMIYNTPDNLVYWYNGTSWQNFATGVALANNYPTSLSYASGTLTIGRNGLPDLTAVLPFSSKLNVTDTTGKWINKVYRRGDSMYYQKGGTEYFACKITVDWLGDETQYIRGDGTVGNFYDDLRAIGDTAYAPKSHSHFASEIIDLTPVVWNMFSGDSNINVNNSNGHITFTGTALAGAITSVFGRTGIVTAQEADYQSFYPRLSQTYANPGWITSLAWSKITGTPTTVAGYGITDALTSVNNSNWSGTQLSVANGGTGATSLTGVLVGNGTSAFSGIAGTANQLLRRNAANTAYEFFTPSYLTSYTETDPGVDALIKGIPVSADATTNKYYYWNNGSIARKQILSSELNNDAGFITSSALSGYELQSNKTTSTTLNGGSANNTRYPTELAVKTYVDNAVSGVTPTLNQYNVGVGDASNHLSGSNNLQFQSGVLAVNQGTGNDGRIDAGYFLLKEIGGVSTPGTGYAHLYPLNDGTLHYKNSSGVDVNLTAGSSTPSLTQYRLAIGNASNLLSTAAAITGSRALVSDANGVPTHSTTTATQVGYLSTTTSDVQTQINSKESSFTTITEDFTGSTSLSFTVAHTIKAGKAVIVFYNGLPMENSAVSATPGGTTVTITLSEGRLTTDKIKIEYPY